MCRVGGEKQRMGMYEALKALVITLIIIPYSPSSHFGFSFHVLQKLNR